MGRGSLDGSHNALLLALLPVNRTLGVVGKKALPEPRPVRRGVRGVEVCLVSDPRAWGCLGMGGGYDMKGFHGALKGRGFSVPSLPGH